MRRVDGKNEINRFCEYTSVLLEAGVASRIKLVCDASLQPKSGLYLITIDISWRLHDSEGTGLLIPFEQSPRICAYVLIRDCDAEYDISHTCEYSFTQLTL
jgi:hypothetical protein